MTKRGEDETLAAAVAKREGDQRTEAEIRLAETEARVEKALGWFARVVPRHVDAEQYVAMAIGVLRRKPKLAEAAWTNPQSFMWALSECARMGLVPGDTYHPVPFWNSKESRYEITGIVDYKGEVDMMYRSGGVSSVHCQLVRGGPTAHSPDHFRWQPTMELPEHVIADDGLADAEDRGPLRAVYAYARLTTGGISEVAVLNRMEVMRARDSAKTKDFWGPEWPEEGENTAMMWRKTGVHRLWWSVPHSSEYVAERMRAEAAALAPILAAGEDVPRLTRRKASNVRALPTASPDVSPAGLPAGEDDTQQSATDTTGEPQGGRGRGNRGAPPPRPQGRRRSPAKPGGTKAHPADKPAEPRSAGEAFDQAEPITGKVVDKPEGEGTS
jgi:recombination protein RecT